MAGLKKLYKIYAVLSVIIGIFACFVGGGSLASLGLILLIFWGGALYLWRLSEENEERKFMYCPNCGKELERITQFCTNCGDKISSEKWPTAKFIVEMKV